MASGGTSPYTYSVTTGALPTGLTLNSTTGVISGTPTAAGTASFTITAEDAATATVKQSYSIAIDATQVTLGSTTLPEATVGQSYSATLPASGGTSPYTFSVSIGSLPAGLTLDTTTGVISGTPTTAGSDSFTVTVQDAAGETAKQNYTLSVQAAGAAEVTGTVFDDADRSGQFASGDPTLGDVTITLTNTATGAIQTLTTSSNGSYSFSGVAAGTYNILAVFPAYLQAEMAILGTGGGGTVDGEEIKGLTVTTGTNDTGYDFDADGIASSFISIRLFLDSTPPLSELMNPQPSVTTIPNQNVSEGATIPPIPFTVADPLLSVSDLTVSASSSNTTLVPDSSISSVGNGGNRTLTVAPAAGHTGTATITTTVSDPFGNATSTTFTVTVSDPSSATGITPDVSALVHPSTSPAILTPSVTTPTTTAPTAVVPAATVPTPAATVGTAANSAFVTTTAATAAPQQAGSSLPYAYSSARNSSATPANFAPVPSFASGTDLNALALALSELEGSGPSGTQMGGLPSSFASSVPSAGSSVSSTQPIRPLANPGSSDTIGSITSQRKIHGDHDVAAVNAAVSDFDLSDLWA